MRISSTQNPVVKYVRSLHRASVRRDEGVFLAEGIRLVSDAVNAGWPVKFAFLVPESLRASEMGRALMESLVARADSSYETTPAVLERICDTETPSGVLAVLPMAPDVSLASFRSARIGVVLDGLKDPGNGGSILRTAAAAGASYLVTTPGTVDLYGPKVVRGGMGAHFRVPVYSATSWQQIRSDLEGVAIVGTDPHDGLSIWEFEWPKCSALVIAGEASGLSPEGARFLDEIVRIPMARQVESLNAAAAAAVCLYAAFARASSETSQRYI